MAVRKRIFALDHTSSCSSSGSGTNDDESTKKQKCHITLATFNKWQGQYNSEHDTLLWLCWDKDRSDKRLIVCLWCNICRKYEKRITSLKNFSRAQIDGTENQQMSNVLDHSSSNQHTTAMVEYNKEEGKVNLLLLTHQLLDV